MIGRGKLNVCVPKLTSENGVFVRPPRSSNVDNYRSVPHYTNRFREINRDSDVYNSGLKR